MTQRGRGALAHRRLLLVDRQQVFAEVLRLRLEPMGCQVTIARSIAEARGALTRESADLVLAAQELDDGAAVDLLDDRTGSGGSPALLVMAEDGEPREVIDAVRRGADGWVLKDDGVSELVDACVGTLAGEMYLSHGIVRQVVERLLLGDQEHTFVSTLSDREREVLGCLVAGMDRQRVAARLFLSPNTVRTHIQNLLRAADVHSTVALVAAAREAGVVGPDEPSSSGGAGEPSV
jgi:DNA-binding NarL/FixJ family response regulator